MSEEIVIDEAKTVNIKKAASIIDNSVITKIINKLTDYAETISEGKLSSIVNYNYSLNRSETNTIIKLLLAIKAISRICSIAQKGTKDLEDEFISNVISDPVNPEGISSYISLRNILENRLTHQTQQYNINMGKNNTTQSMPINELRGHVKTYIDLNNSNVTVSSRAQHGYIAASLHDAYITIINRSDFWNDKTYIKFFFNEDDRDHKNQLIITRDPRQSLIQINRQITEAVEQFASLKQSRDDTAGRVPGEDSPEQSAKNKKREAQAQMVNDPTMLTPFGRRYGSKVNSIIMDIFNPEKEVKPEEIETEEYHDTVETLYSIFLSTPEALTIPVNATAIIKILDPLLFLDIELKAFAEKYLYKSRKESLSRFYSENNTNIENFMSRVYSIYFEEKFSSLFRIIKSSEMRTFACAFIIKRIYILQGENLTTFGFFFVKAIARTGKIQIS